MPIFRAGVLGGGKPNEKPLIFPVTVGTLFITLESSFFDFLLTEDDFFITTG
jgi:hypothetical protein